MSISGLPKFALAFANGAVLSATITLAWNSASPFHGGGPNLIGLVGTATLLACFLGAGLASLVNRQSSRLLAQSLLWILAGLFLVITPPLYPRVLEMCERFGLLPAVAGSPAGPRTAKE